MKKLVLKKETITKLTDDQMKKFMGGAADAASCHKKSCDSQINGDSCNKKSCSCASQIEAIVA